MQMDQNIRPAINEIIRIAGCYRAGELGFDFDEAHVYKWIEQFDENVRLPLLNELAYVLERTYISESSIDGFIESVISCQEIHLNNEQQFWSTANFICADQAGGSQRAILERVNQIFIKKYGFGLSSCGGSNNYIYIDDFICSGGTVNRDLTSWLTDALPNSKLYVISIVEFTGAYYYLDGFYNKLNDSGKNIRCFRFTKLKPKNTPSEKDWSDILWPTKIPCEATAYVANLSHGLKLRTPPSVGALKLFSSEEGRSLLEQEFVKMGVKIRYMCPLLPPQLRPLGSMFLDSFGFGAMHLTYRNCPNNTPLALWAGYPWYPLFPRKTN